MELTDLSDLNVSTISKIISSIQLKDSALTVDDFELIKVIGTGSYGKVFLSKKKDTQEVYAVKTLNKKHLIKKN